MEEEARLLERQWSLKRERARYDAERARRQYDAVEPENRLVARSLERVWEEKLRRAEQIEQEFDVWRRHQALTSADTDRQHILALGENLPRLWHAATTTPADRKQIVRLGHCQLNQYRNEFAQLPFTFELPDITFLRHSPWQVSGNCCNGRRRELS